jgi:hypothetical protein
MGACVLPGHLGSIVGLARLGRDCARSQLEPCHFTCPSTQVLAEVQSSADPPGSRVSSVRSNRSTAGWARKAHAGPHANGDTVGGSGASLSKASYHVPLLVLAISWGFQEQESGHCV